jgi:hypothetical protein
LQKIIANILYCKLLKTQINCKLVTVIVPYTQGSPVHETFDIRFFLKQLHTYRGIQKKIKMEVFDKNPEV